MALIFNDTFTTVADANLQDHTPDTGTSWTELWATTANLGWNVDSTDVLQGETGSSSGAIHTANATYDSADYSVSALMDTLDSSPNDSMYLLVRIQDQENMYAVRLRDQNGTGTCQLYKKVAGTWSALGSAFDPPANGSVIKLEIIGSALKFYDDDVEVASATDGDITAAGKAGLGHGGGAELVASTDSLGLSTILDNFSVTTTGAGTVVKDVISEGIIATPR